MAEEVEINIKALVGGIIGGIIASSYAFGILIMGSLGFDPVTSSLIVKYRIHLIVIGAITALIFSFKRTKETFSFSKSSALASVLSFGFIFAIGVYVITPLLAQVVYGDTQQSIINGNAQQEIIKGDYKVLTLSVPGMACSGCTASVQGALKNAAGIVDAKVTLSNKQAVVTYDPAVTTKEKIVNLEIFTSIYPATIVKDEDYRRE